MSDEREKNSARLPFIWGITDGSAGMRAQVQGVLEALELPHEMRDVQVPFPWRVLPVWANLHTPPRPWPDVVVSSGRKGAMVALAMKRKSGGRIKIIHLTDPRAARARFDLIVAMAHDPARGPNVMHTRFALHRITPARLAEAAMLWKPRFAAYPGPYISVLIGGSTNQYTLDVEAMQALVADLQRVLAATAGSLLITASRRTGEGNIHMLREAFAGHKRVYIYSPLPLAGEGQGGGGENPYLGMLAVAEHVIVTNDSVNMMSEALATGKPAHILPLAGHKNTKPARFAEMLMKEGYARPLALPLAPFTYPAPEEIQAVVERVRALLASG